MGALLFWRVYSHGLVWVCLVMAFAIPTMALMDDWTAYFEEAFSFLAFFSLPFLYTLDDS